MRLIFIYTHMKKAHVSQGGFFFVGQKAKSDFSNGFKIIEGKNDWGIQAYDNSMFCSAR